jgi:AAA domain
VEERRLARSLFKERLPVSPWFRDRATFDVITWDDPEAPIPMPAQLTPQEAINRGLKRPSECDIVVVILWSRMGTPLPEQYKKCDGSSYLSGTEYEYSDALNCAVKTGSPNILLYRRTDVPSLPINVTTEQRIEAETQWNRVEQFCASLRNPDGSYRAGIHTYSSPEHFHHLLDQHVQALLARILESSSEIENSIDLFTPPVLTGVVPREPLLTKLIDAYGQAPVLCITGISGNGKTYLAAQLTARLLQTRTLKSVLWCEAEKNEPLDGLLSKLHARVGLHGQSVQMQCKELIKYLIQQSCVLVIDDYQLANRETYFPLLRYAASQRPPTTVLIITRLYPEEISEYPSVTVFSVEDFFLTRGHRSTRKPWG